MLECPSLWLDPPRPEGEGQYRAIRDARTLAVLGHAFVASGWGGAALAWLLRKTYHICESPDGSLLCLVQRSWRWSAWRTVLDADREVVARLRQGKVLSADGRIIATEGSRCFLAPDGTELATWSAEKAGTLLEFRPAIDEAPLVKMALLAAVLER